MKWKDNNICIYGLGAYGLKTYFLFKDYGIKIACFGDRDEGKCGYALEGMECKNYQEVISYEKDKWTIIVAIENSKKLVERFKNLGFQCSLSYSEAIEQLQESDIPCEKKEYEPIRDLELVKKYKKELEYVLSYGIRTEELNHMDMQVMLEDCIKRQKDRDRYCENSTSKQ